MNDFVESISSSNPDPLLMAVFADQEAVVIDKLRDAATPAFEAEFTPEEAEIAGAFSEDALSESDAAASAGDAAEVPDSVAPAGP